jgi:hypothetical protein
VVAAMNYLIVGTVTANGACRLTSIKNVPEDQRLHTGVSCSAGFPDDALFKMNDSFPKAVRLVDSLRNISSLLVVSERFKNALLAISGALEQNEVLPVKIVNHRGRTEKAPYSIIHQLNYPACVDGKKSKGIRSTLDPSQFQFMTTLVLDEAKIPSNLMLFRAAEFPGLPLIRSDLAAALDNLGLTGVEFCQIAGYEF